MFVFGCFFFLGTNIPLAGGPTELGWAVFRRQRKSAGGDGDGRWQVC